MTAHVTTNGGDRVHCGRPGGNFRDLRPRVVSSVTMLAAALGCLFAGVWPFAILTWLIALAMSWEWGRLVRGHDGIDATYVIHAGAVTLAIALTAVGYVAFGLLASLLGALAILALARARPTYLSAVGVPYCAWPAIHLVWLRQSEPDGAIAVLFLFAIVWASETAAFLAGRTFGGARLWPSVSPNKTWTGTFAGMLAAVITAVFFAAVVTSAPLVLMAVSGLMLAVVATVGDLAASALKRGHGVKDTSDLIPGHGGVMDRMDGIAAVAIVAGLAAWILAPSAPASALLHGMRP